MINKDQIIVVVKGPMQQYCQIMRQTIGDWQPLLAVSEKKLAGAEVRNGEVQPELEFLVEWMRLIMEVTRDGQWDWTSPAVQAVYKNYADSMIYKTFARAVQEHWEKASKRPRPELSWKLCLTKLSFCKKIKVEPYLDGTVRVA
jgi:hypothetical protein